MKSYAAELNYDLVRDKLLIVSTPAYRRLAQKSQVFPNISGVDGHLYRTRLTHTMEVATLSELMSIRLGLNPNLAGILGHAHDIGHACFGHAGQDVINDLLMSYTNNKEKFEHNSQAQRILSILDKSTVGVINPLIISGLAKRDEHGLETPCNFGESQVMDICDNIAYAASDVQDALNLGVLSLDKLFELRLFKNKTLSKQKDLFIADVELGNEKILSAIRTYFFEDVVKSARLNIRNNAISHMDDFKHLNDKVVNFSDQRNEEMTELMTFMFENVYATDSRLKDIQVYKTIITQLFDFYMCEDNFMLLGNGAKERYLNDENSRARSVADYIAGCDDRFIVQLHNKFVTSA